MSLKQLVYALSVAAVVTGAVVSMAVVSKSARTGESGVLPEVVVTAKAPALLMDTVEVVRARVSSEPLGFVNYN